MAVGPFTHKISRLCGYNQDAVTGHGQALKWFVEFVAETATFKSAVLIPENRQPAFFDASADRQAAQYISV